MFLAVQLVQALLQSIFFLIEHRDPLIVIPVKAVTCGIEAFIDAGKARIVHDINLDLWIFCNDCNLS